MSCFEVDAVHLCVRWSISCVWVWYTQ